MRWTDKAVRGLRRDLRSLLSERGERTVENSFPSLSHLTPVLYVMRWWETTLGDVHLSGRIDLAGLV